MLTYGELFAGVGGMTMGFEDAGFEVRWHAENNRYCRSVLRYHWMDVPLYGDVCDVRGDQLEPVDVIAFGSPCQDLSVAGQRLGFEGGDRSVLFLEAIRIIKEMRRATDGARPRWAVWENVGGALTSNRGADFGTALDSLADAGALVIEWCQLDAQFLGVPQRRRRPFTIACFDPGAARGCPDPLLPVPAGRPRSSVAGREAWDQAREAVEAGADSGVQVYDHGKPRDVAAPLMTRAFGRSRMEDSIIVYTKGRRAQNNEDDETWETGRAAPTLSTFDNTGPVRATILATDGIWVRRFTPKECERLMGWPDDHTAQGIDDRQRIVPISDSQRGKMVGNGVATPVARFIADQIKAATPTA